MIKKFNLLQGLLFSLIVLATLNHKELFSISAWGMVPVRFLLVFFILAAIVTLYKNIKLIDPIFILLSGLSLFVWLSTLVAANKLDAVLFSFFYLSLPAYYLVYKKLLLENKKFIESFLNVYLLAFFISLCFLIFQIIYYTTTTKLVGAIWPVPDHFPRYGALFWDINHFAAFAVINIWILVYKIKTNFKNQKLFFGYSVFLLFSVGALYLTSSRSSVMGLVIGIVCFITLLSINSKSKFKVVLSKLYLPIFSLLPIIIYFVSEVFGSYVRNFFFYRIHSFFTHFILIKIGFNLFKENPWLGIGANNFNGALKDSIYFKDFSLLDPGALNYKIPIHSVWMHFLTEGGIFTFILFLLTISFSIYLLLKAYKKHSSFLDLSLLCALISMLFAGIFYSYNLEFYWTFLVFILFYSYYRVNFSTGEFKVFFIKIFSIKNMSVSIILASFIFIISNIDVSPTLNEISFFNAAKTSAFSFSLINFTSLITQKYQYMFGYFPYVARLIPLTFLVPCVGMLYFVLKFKNKFLGFLTSLSLTFLIFFIFNSFQLGLSSFYIYISFVLVAILSLFFSKYSVEHLLPKSNYFIIALSLICFMSVYFSFRLLVINSYTPNVSKITNSLAQKYSLNNFNIYTSNKEFIDAISFYLEPTSVVKHSPPDLKGDSVYITYQDVNFKYDRVITYQNIFAFLNFNKVNVL